MRRIARERGEKSGLRSCRRLSPVVGISLGYGALAALWIFGSDHALGLLAGTRERMVAWSVYKGLGFVAVTTGFLFVLLRRTFGALETSNRELRRHERHLRRLGRLNAALGDIGLVVARIPAQEELFRRACDALVERGGFQLAWIGWANAPGERLTPASAAGDADGCVPALCASLEECGEGGGPAWRTLQAGRPCIRGDEGSGFASVLERDASERNRWRSSAALPIREDGVIRGALCVYAEEPFFFQETELALMEEAAAEISFALEARRRDDERRRAEELAAAERRFSGTMIDSMPGVLYFYDEAGRFLRWNQNFARVSGCGDAEIETMRPLDFIGSQDRGRMTERIREVFERGESSVEADFLAKDGRRIPFFFTGRRVEFDGRRCLVGVGIDITERRRAEDALRESEERFRATFEQAAVGIAHVSPEGRFRWVNDQLCVITGHPRGELLKLTFSELTLPEDAAEGEEALRSLLAGERAEFTTEKRYRRKDGDIAWVGVILKLIRDGSGRPNYFVVVVADITERKRLEQQFFRAQRLESIGTLAGGLAHDLNNLLAPVMMGVEMLRLGRLDAGEALVVDNMERSARRAASLVRRVLSFARGAEGVRSRLDLCEVLRETEAFVASTFPRNIEWRADIAADLWPVIGDVTQLHQVLLNLCVNARDAMPAGGRISVRLFNMTLTGDHPGMRHGESAGRHAVIEVMDEGCGMDADLRDRIFEPFFTTKAPGKGTGLGLSTVLGIVRGHGGRVEVDSDPGRGSTFRVFLPAMPEDAEGMALVTTERPRAGEGELVLVIDGESSMLEVTRQMLVTFGYRAELVSNGAEAVAIFARRREEFSVVIADLSMPAMGGRELIDSLREIDPAVPVIGVAGKSESASDGEGAPGVILPKPFAADTLLLALGRALEMRKKTAGSTHVDGSQNRWREGRNDLFTSGVFPPGEIRPESLR